MKLHIAILVLLTFFSLNHYKVNQSCQGARKGTFTSIDEKAGTTIIQRNDSIQLEENKTLGIKYLEKLKWIDDCSYVIYEIKVLESKGKISNPSGNFTVSLEQINDSIFEQTVLIEKFNFKHTSTITKVSNNVSNEFKELLKKL